MQTQGKIENIDVELTREFSALLCICFEINTAEVTVQEYFPRSLQAFSEILTHIHSADLNRDLVHYFSTIASKLTQKFARQSQPVQQVFVEQYREIVGALLFALSKPDMEGKNLTTIARALQNIINWSFTVGQDQKLREHMVYVLQASPIF